MNFRVTRVLKSLMISSMIFTLPSFALDVYKTNQAPVIDGQIDENLWKNAQWQSLDKHILGAVPESQDFSGKFKLLWDEQALYLLAEITDDVLLDRHANPLEFYWDDDCLEIFIDEDKSGGNHQYNFNAFAYHVALDNQAVDIGEQLEDGTPEFILLNDHVTSHWQRSSEQPHHIIWELAINVFDDSFSLKDNAKKQLPVRLTKDKMLGFMVAYCDNDASENREHFMGNIEITPDATGDKNLGYKDASVFGEIRLVE